MEPTRKIKFMTYNVWSREDMVVRLRMEAIGKLVRQHNPDVIFFQEVTPHILRIFRSHSWWEDYTCSPVEEAIATGQHFCLLLSKLPTQDFARWPFPNLSTGRSYLEARVFPGRGMKPIHVATTHLESPVPPTAMRCVEHATQAEQAVSALNREVNVVFGGDMCWDDKVDLPFPLLTGWVDAAEKPGHVHFTFDELWNRKPSNAGYRQRESRSLYEKAITQRRSDRFVCKLNDYKLQSMGLIGNESSDERITSYGYKLEFNNDTNKKIYFLPSSHFGVVLSIVPNEEDP